MKDFQLILFLIGIILFVGIGIIIRNVNINNKKGSQSSQDNQGSQASKGSQGSQGSKGSQAKSLGNVSITGSEGEASGSGNVSINKSANNTQTTNTQSSITELPTETLSVASLTSSISQIPSGTSGSLQTYPTVYITPFVTTEPRPTTAPATTTAPGITTAPSVEFTDPSTVVDLPDDLELSFDGDSTF